MDVKDFEHRLTEVDSVAQHDKSAPTGDGLSNIAFVGKKTTANGVHPTTSGYYQIADAVYRKFTSDHQ